MDCLLDFVNSSHSHSTMLLQMNKSSEYAEDISMKKTNQKQNTVIQENTSAVRKKKKKKRPNSLCYA